MSTSPPVGSSNSLLANGPSSFSFLKLRSIFDKSVKLVEKKLNLAEFLANSNTLINNMTTFNTLNINGNFGLFSPISNTINNSLGVSANTNSSSNNFGGSTGSLNQAAFGLNSNNGSYFDLISSALTQAANSYTSSASSPANVSNSNTTSSSSSSIRDRTQLNFTLLMESGSKQQSSGGRFNRQKLESQIIPKISHLFNLFNSKTRIELIAIEIPENVISVLANGLHLEMEAESFDSNWRQCLDKLNNTKYKKQLINHRFDEIIKDLRYGKKSKVFILYTLKTHQFKLLVSP
jgi:hypothetical protein